MGKREGDWLRERKEERCERRGRMRAKEWDEREKGRDEREEEG